MKLCDKSCHDCLLEKSKLITAIQCAEILGVSASRARHLMQYPDDVKINSKNVFTNLYDKQRVIDIKESRLNYKKKRESDLGKKQCYLCKKKYDCNKLQNRQCQSCIANRCVCNFLCKNNKVKNCMDCSLLFYLKKAIKDIEDKVKNEE